MMYQLEFTIGDMNQTHVITILDDSECEINPNERFFSDLVYVSGDMTINIDPNRTMVEINDDNEKECGELL